MSLIHSISHLDINKPSNAYVNTDANIIVSFYIQILCQILDQYDN